MSAQRIVGIIPSRLQSSRVPRKPLVDICGMPMIAHVMLRAGLSDQLDDLYVATDSPEIVDVVARYGGRAVLTRSTHRNGTERLAEAARDIAADYVVLINGDEALLQPPHIRVSVEALRESDAQASILVSSFRKESSPSDFKVVLNLNNEVMYISRNDIPSGAKNPVSSRLKAYHILTFRKDFLLQYAAMERSPLEQIEDHEHLRIIENGHRIVARKVDSTAISVDTPADLEFVRQSMGSDPYFAQYRDAGGV